MNRRTFLAVSGLATATNLRASRTAQTAEPLSIGLLTDVQYADADPSGERHYRESLPKLREAVADLAAEKLAFTLHLGDVIDRDFASFGKILPLFDALGHPVRHLLGNHDYEIADAHKPRVPEILGMPADRYSFTAAGVRFVMLDTTEVSTYKHAEDSPETAAARHQMKRLAAAGEPHAKPWNGGVSDEQLAWLESQLAAADRAEENVIVCGHHPLRPPGGHQAWNHEDILATIRRHGCVRACFSGHNHGGHQAEMDGVVHLTFKSILHEPGVTAYAVLRIFPDRLVIEGRGREASRVIDLPRRQPDT